MVPTQYELDLLEVVPDKQTIIQTCGFGPIESAARTGHLLNRFHPRRVVLVGIAGRIRQNLEIGKAYFFSSVELDGVGVGSGGDFQSAHELGWQENHILPLATPDTHRSVAGGLLTVCASSANPIESSARKEKFTLGQAEEMESYAVATTCSIYGFTPFVIRGISNDAGDRNHQNWQSEKAMASVSQLLSELIKK